VDFEAEATPLGDGSTTLVSVYGELDLETCGRLAPVAEQAISARRAIILDLTDCRFIDSSGLREVLRVSERGNNGGGPAAPTAIVSPRGSATAKLFELTGVEPRVRLFGTIEDAMAWLDTAREPNGDSGPPDPARRGAERS
jgi:anti-anti-sigma factor